MRQNAPGKAYNPKRRGAGPRKGHVVDGSFFRVDGADLESGQDRFLVVQAASEHDAEELAREQGLLIASVRPASVEDQASVSQIIGSKPTFYSIFSDSQPVVAPIALAEAPQEPIKESRPEQIDRPTIPLDEGKASAAPPAVAKSAQPPPSRPVNGPAAPTLAPAGPKSAPPLRPPVAASSRRIPPPPMPKRPAAEPLSPASPEIAEAHQPVDKAEMPLAVQTPEPEVMEEPVEVAPPPSPRATSLIAGAVDLRRSTPHVEALETPLAPAVEPEPVFLPAEPPPKPVAPQPLAVSLHTALPKSPTSTPTVADRAPAGSVAPAVVQPQAPAEPVALSAAATPVAATEQLALHPRNAPAAGWVATVILSPLGFLSVAGGIALLVYSLNRPELPDASDIQKLDGHVQLLTHCLLGAVLLLSGLFLFVAAGLVYVGGGLRNAKQR